MGEIFPSWDIINNYHNELWEGERKIASYLESNLSDDWEIYIQPFLNGSRPDIIILNPKIGIMIIEVKDWDIKNYFFKNEELYVRTRKGIHEIENPINQVRYYRNNLIGLIPQLDEIIRENFRLISVGIYFNKEMEKNVNKFFLNGQKIYANEILLGNDGLNVGKIENVFDSGKIKQKISIPLELLDMIRIWLSPPYHSKEQTSNIKLISQQRIHAKPNAGHHRIRGVIGSGKTLVLAYRAAALAEQNNKVLIITFNKTLWHYIKDMVQRTPFNFDPKLIIYKHFHGFCNDFLNEMNIPKPHDPKDNDYYFKKIASAVKNALEMSVGNEKNIKDFKFDAILIDEGQDFKFEWYEILNEFLKQRNELVIMCDKAQNIYGRELSWIYTGMKDFPGRWGELNRSVRLPWIVVREANRFAEMYLPDRDMHAESYQKQLFEPELKWISCKSIDEAMNQAEAAFDYLHLEKEQHPTDIVMLFLKIKLGEEMVERLRKQNIEVNDVFSDRHKKSFWMGDSRTKVSTIHSFKGWELKNIILVINDRKKSPNLSSLIYTAIGRTQENLIVINVSPDYDNYGKSWPNIEHFEINKIQ